jgi:tetratricopeptide (TPR) repeat protein
MPANEYPAERLRTALLAAERCRAISEYAEGRSIADRVREQAEALQRWDLAAAAALSAARIELRRDAPTCRRLATEAAALFRKVGDQLGELDCEWLLAFDQAGSGGGEPAMRRAAAVIDAALELKQFSRAALWMPITAGFLGSTGFPNEARAMYERSIELAQRIGSPPEKGIHLGLARLDALSNRYDEGIDRVKRALADEEWDRFPTLFACRTIGILLLRAGRLAEAGEYLERGVRLSEETGERMSRSELCARRAIAAVYEGKLDVGADYAKRAIDTAQADDPSAQFESHWALAELRWAEGRESDAYESFKVGFSRLTYYDDVTVEVVLRFARFLIETGRADEARPLLDRANEWLETAGYLYGRSEIAKLREKLIQSEGSRLLY